MSEIIKVYRQEIPALRFIGKKYGDEDRVNGGFGKLWGDWFQNGWFAVIEQQSDKRLRTVYADGDAYIGLMRWKDGEPFAYWIGIFMPESTPVPEEFAYKDFPAAALGVCWVYGQEGQVYMQEKECARRLGQEGYVVTADGEGAHWFFERYGCPRFTTPDEKGNIILDICHYVK